MSRFSKKIAKSDLTDTLKVHSKYQIGQLPSAMRAVIKASRQINETASETTDCVNAARLAMNE